MESIRTKEEAKEFAECVANEELYDWVIETMMERLKTAGMDYIDHTCMREAASHICQCIRSLVRDAFGIMGAGDFIRNVVKNDLSKAAAYADGINLKNLDIYVTFMYNYMPNPEYLKQIREGG